MKVPHHIALVAAFMLIGCTTAKHNWELSELLPNYTPVPQEIIDDLPRRIERLPTSQSMSGARFLAALGLEDYSGNISGSVRFNSHYLELNETHTLQIRCDPESLIIRDEDIDKLVSGGDALQAESRLNGLGCEVVGCTLRENWDHVLAHRQLATAGAETPKIGLGDSPEPIGC